MSPAAAIVHMMLIVREIIYIGDFERRIFPLSPYKLTMYTTASRQSCRMHPCSDEAHLVHLLNAIRSAKEKKGKGQN